MEKLNIIKHNFFKIVTYLMGIILGILMYFNGSNIDKPIIAIGMVLICILIIKLLFKINEVNICFSRAYVFKITRTMVEYLLLVLLGIVCLFFIASFSGYISVLLDGYFNIDTRSWLGFIGTFLSAMLGVFGGALGGMILSKDMIQKYNSEHK
jgi:hypothetical protein